MEDLFSNHKSYKDTSWKTSLEEQLEEKRGTLQEEVMNNYEKFIDTSKQISSFLEHDIIELSNSLIDLKRCIKTMQRATLDCQKST